MRQFLFMVVALVTAIFILEPSAHIVPQWETPPIVTPVSTPNGILVQAGRVYKTRTGRTGVLSLQTGQPHPVLQKMAEEHAEYQARHGVQGHQLWEERVQRLMADMPECTDFAEVANESWPNQDINAAAHEMYNSWEQSKGHWSCVNGRCDYYGYAMVLSYNGTWYACGILLINDNE